MESGVSQVHITTVLASREQAMEEAKPEMNKGKLAHRANNVPYRGSRRTNPSV